MSLQPGEQVKDYTIVKRLGQGGMGIVYLAIHKDLGQQVVLKSLHQSLLGDTEMRARFVREAETMSRLTHPNILKVFSLLDLDDGVYIVMEYVEGESFEDLLNRAGLVTPQRAVQLLKPVLSALQYAHDRGIIHRDVKPANVMLLTNGEVRVLDFGIAKILDRPGLTRVGMTLGTASYMAPEQHMGKALSPGADIYALGVTLFELMTGQLPFEAPSTTAFIRRVLQEAPTRPRIFEPGIPVELEEVTLKCLAREPEGRYQSANEVVEALDAALRDAPEPAARVAASSLTAAHPTPFSELPVDEQNLAIAGTCMGIGILLTMLGSVLLALAHLTAGLVIVGLGIASWLGATIMLVGAIMKLQAQLVRGQTLARAAVAREPGTATNLEAAASAPTVPQPSANATRRASAMWRYQGFDSEEARELTSARPSAGQTAVKEPATSDESA